MATVGQALAQAGIKPMACRSLQRVHFVKHFLLVKAITLNVQLATQ